LTKGKHLFYKRLCTNTLTMRRYVMLGLALGYVIQQDREREVVDDLRNRQALQRTDADRIGNPSAGQVLAASRQAVEPVDPRRSPVRARGTGA
jgi:hypothetical protein